MSGTAAELGHATAAIAASVLLRLAADYFLHFASYLCCSACRAVWYCGTACSHADWRAGHRRVCKALATARAAEKAARRQTAEAAGAADEQA